MGNSQFWRLLAGAAVGGIFYFGHGLHVDSGDLPAIDSPAFGGAPWGQNGHSDFFTVSEDGSIVYQWRNSGGRVKFAGSVRAEVPVESQKPTL
jgi:hypothetical protein